MKMTNSVRTALLAIVFAWPLSGTAAEVRQPIIAGDVELFYGVMPASVLLGHPADHAERTMHGGVQVTRNTYHLVVSMPGGRRTGQSRRCAPGSITSRACEHYFEAG